MSNVTISVSMELKNKLDLFDEVNWSAVARNAFTAKIRQLEVLDRIASKSKLTEKDALELGGKVNKSLWKNHYKKLVE
ncbi:MAG: hypothetical protein ABH821_01390 [archaeon]